MPGLQTASAREDTCIWNQEGTSYWATSSNCRETKWFRIFLRGGNVTNPINELDLISEIQKQGKDKKCINPKIKDTLLLQECIWWIRSHLSAASSQKGLWFHFLCFHFLLKQPWGRNDQTQHTSSTNSRSYQSSQGEPPLVPINH